MAPQLVTYAIDDELFPEVQDSPLNGQRLATFPLPPVSPSDLAQPEADAILDRARSALARLSQDAYAEIMAAVQHGEIGPQIDAVRLVLEKYTPFLARIIADTQLAALTAGMARVVNRLPAPLGTHPLPGIANADLPESLSPEEAQRVAQEILGLTEDLRWYYLQSLPPEHAEYVESLLTASQPEIVAPGQPGSPGGPSEPIWTGTESLGEPNPYVHYPMMDAAVQSLQNRKIMRKEQFDQLAEDAKREAFTVAGVESVETLGKILDVLTGQVREGASYRDFQKKVTDAVGKGTFLSPQHMETVFRAGVQTAFADGQDQVMSHPFVAGQFPYMRYTSVADDRRRPDHAAMEFHGLNGTPIYRTDDPIWKKYRGPWDYLCRCGRIPMSIKQAALAGVHEAIEWLASGKPPEVPEWVQDPGFQPSNGFVNRGLLSLWRTVRQAESQPGGFESRSGNLPDEESQLGGLESERTRERGEEESPLGGSVSKRNAPSNASVSKRNAPSNASQANGFVDGGGSSYPGFQLSLEWVELDGEMQLALRAPKGGIQVAGKWYQGGRFIPNAQIAQASPTELKTLYGAEAAKKTQMRSDVSPEDIKGLRGNLAKYLHVPLEKEHLSSAKRAYSSLKREHGAETLHRIHQLMKKDEASLAATPEDEEGIRDQLHKRLRSYSHMLDWTARDMTQLPSRKSGWPGLAETRLRSLSDVFKKIDNPTDQDKTTQDFYSRIADGEHPDEVVKALRGKASDSLLKSMHTTASNILKAEGWKGTPAAAKPTGKVGKPELVGRGLEDPEPRGAVPEGIEGSGAETYKKQAKTDYIKPDLGTPYKPTVSGDAPKHDFPADAPEGFTSEHHPFKGGEHLHHTESGTTIRSTGTGRYETVDRGNMKTGKYGTLDEAVAAVRKDPRSGNFEPGMPGGPSHEGGVVKGPVRPEVLEKTTETPTKKPPINVVKIKAGADYTTDDGVVKKRLGGDVFAAVNEDGHVTTSGPNIDLYERKHAADSAVRRGALATLPSEIKQDKPDFDTLVKAARDYRYLAAKEEPEGRKESREHQQHATKSALDNWLMKHYGLDASEARDVSNRAGEDPGWESRDDQTFWTESEPEPTGEGLPELPWRAKKTSASVQTATPVKKTPQQIAYEARMGVPSTDAARSVKKPKHRQTKAEYAGNDPSKAAEHRIAVENAIIKGTPVYEGWEKDYPEFKKDYPEAQQPFETTTPGLKAKLKPYQDTVLDPEHEAAMRPVYEKGKAKWGDKFGENIHKLITQDELFLRAMDDPALMATLDLEDQRKMKAKPEKARSQTLQRLKGLHRLVEMDEASNLPREEVEDKIVMGEPVPAKELEKHPDLVQDYPEAEVSPKASFRTVRAAADELQSIRNDLAGSDPDHTALQARIDAVGAWAANQPKHSTALGNLLTEAHQLADKIGGGSGKGGVRISPTEQTAQTIAAQAAPEIFTPKEAIHAEGPGTVGRPGESEQSAFGGGDVGGGRNSDVGGADGGSAGGVGGPARSGPRILTARAELTRPADPSVVPESLRGQLRPHQVETVARALTSMKEHGGHLISSGTGVGKSAVQLSVGKIFADEGKKVIIITKKKALEDPDWKKGTFAGSFNTDAKRMGFGVVLNDGTKDLKEGEIQVSTYQKLSKLKGKVDSNTVVLWDESHTMKNYTSATTKHGREMSQKAAAVLFSTATPADKPLHIDHLRRAGIFGDRHYAETFKELGMHLVDQHTPQGTIKVWKLDPHVGAAESYRRMAGLFDRMTEDGLMTKHELSMDGVDVSFDRVELPPEAHEAMAKVEAEVRKQSGGNPGLQAAMIKMQQRRQQEPFKIPHAIDAAKKELEEGRQVVIFASRVNKSKVGGGEDDDEPPAVESEGTLKTLKAELAKAGITDIAELHGGAAKTPAVQRKMMDNFQSGKAKVMIATIESGGTGINLDDTIGNAPRTVLMMTAPFSAVENVQAAGRVHRLNTKSDSRIKYLFGDTEVDHWNAALIAKKMKTLNAAVSGEVWKLDVPDLHGEFDEAVEEDPETRAQGLIAKLGPYKWRSLLKEKVAPSDFRMPIGAHKGKQLKDIPQDYLSWAVNGMTALRSEQREAIQKHLGSVPKPATPAQSVPVQPALPAASTPFISEDQREAVHTALKSLAGNDRDRARMRNEVGFNQMDSDTGGRLAVQDKLSDVDTMRAADLLRKYHRQIPAELLKAATTFAERPRAADAPKPVVTLHVVTGNTYQHKDTIRALGGRWNSQERVWVIPASAASKLPRGTSSRPI